MADQSPPQIPDVTALRPMFEALADVVRTMHRALGGDEGIRELTSQLEQAQVFREQWEREHPGIRWGTSCYCMCQRWHPLGECTGEAEILRTTRLQGEPIDLALCQACADAQAAARR